MSCSLKKCQTFVIGGSGFWVAGVAGCQKETRHSV